ncbi:MAG: hypothetical protein AAF804_04950, partial [Bacteroidota bacterium]
FDRLPVHLRTYRTRLATDHGDPFELESEIPAYTCHRECYDEMLLNLVKDQTEVEVHEGEKVLSIAQASDHVVVQTTAAQYQAKMVIGCDGSRSLTSKSLRGEETDRKYFGAAIRAYYQGVAGMAMDRTEIFIQKKYLPGYFWLFPLPDGQVNVGFGIRTRIASRRKLDLRETMDAFIQASPELQKRFAGASLVSQMEYELPFSSQQVPVSGNRTLLAGDAASLLDPFSPEGISHATLSGHLAARQVMRCFEEERFDADYMKAYDATLWKGLGSGIRQKSWVHQMAATYPGLVDLSLRMIQFAPVRQLVRRYL